MTDALHPCLWPKARMLEAALSLARRHRIPNQSVARDADEASPHDIELPPDRGNASRGRALERLRIQLGHFGYASEELRCTYGELPDALRQIGPALVPVAQDDGVQYIALSRARGAKLVLLCPDGSVRSQPVTRVARAVAQNFRNNLRRTDLPAALERAGLEPAEAEEALLAVGAEEHHGNTFIGPFLVIRAHATAPMLEQARAAGAGSALLTFLLCQVLAGGATVAAWWLLGRGVLEGHLDRAWVVAWAMLLMFLVPIGSIAAWAQGHFAIAFGRSLKQRLFERALQRPVQSAKQQQHGAEGVGGLLGRVLESSAVESLFLSGSLSAVSAVIEVSLALLIALSGPRGGVQAIAFALVLMVGLWLARRHVQRVYGWTRTRLHMTHELIENMIGHRTRLAQETPSLRHQSEDLRLEAYLRESIALDQGSVLWIRLLPRLWLVVGAVPLIATLAQASVTDTAIGVGALLLGYRALTTFTAGFSQLSEAFVAWKHVEPLDRIGVEDIPDEGDAASILGDEEAATGPVLEAHDLAYQYPDRAVPAFAGMGVVLGASDRVLIEGPSGSGKSTLASVLSGIRRPSRGLMLLDGLDQHTLGSRAWRSRVVTVPQFSDNHIFTGSFAFNALLGGDWPPSEQTLAELRELCEAVGLGPLVDKMPGGVGQMVGSHGWTLSHGERSRLFLLRAFMQRDARVWILDESFAALDPITLRRCVEVVLERAPSLMVIAHP